MFNWFKKGKTPPDSTLQVDIHSHLLPALDDGVKTLEEALEIILQFHSLGYRKLITTPHIMSDVYPNTEDGIREQLAIVKASIQKNKIEIEVEAAAEYYLDENLMQKLTTNHPLLTFGESYLLFETNFLNEPLTLKEFIFLATTKGYKPVLAHPERYMYLENNLGKAEDLLDRGVLFQLNIGSLTGLYSKPAQRMAHKLIDNGWVHFLGSDCHHRIHARQVEEVRKLKYFQKALALPLLNNTL
ncbi:MAG: capsular biosynthesis protein [Cyclobacteriaceae bacterium]|nr:capsular biosynthesis protein [Cyclobacteriaceae bacterium]